MRQEQQSSQQTYYPMHYGHAQALLPGPPPHTLLTISNVSSHAKSMEAKLISAIQCSISITRSFSCKQQPTKQLDQAREQLPISFSGEQ